MEHLKYEYSKTITRSLVLCWVYPSTLKIIHDKGRWSKWGYQCFLKSVRVFLRQQDTPTFPSVQLHSVLPGLKELLDCDSRWVLPYLPLISPSLIFFYLRYCQKILPSIVREKKPENMLGYKRVWIGMSEKQGEFSVILLASNFWTSLQVIFYLVIYKDGKFFSESTLAQLILTSNISCYISWLELATIVILEEKIFVCPSVFKIRKRNSIKTDQNNEAEI